MPSSAPGRIYLLAILVLALSPAAQANDATVAGTAAATAPSSTWIAWEVPFTGDDDRDGWTVVELGLAAGGPFDLIPARKIPGPPEWRADSVRGLTPDTDHYLRFTFVDPDGVTGVNPQIVGPVHTAASAPNAVTLGTTTVESRETEIFVSVPIADDANGNSYGTVEVATSAAGPWTERCGSPSENRLPYHPKRCRLRSLVPGTDYWVRIDLADPDGITGTDPQILGPITYTGRQNLAAGRPITADPGWGCCPNPAQLLDGRIQYRSWFYGFAWWGGTTGYAGGPAGWKQATIDLGAPVAFDRVEMWLHDNNSPPTAWRVETSDDGATWTEAWSTTDPQCRGATEQLQGTSWGHPACSQGALFDPVTRRYVRYLFDDRTLFGGLHGWAVELEVFAPPPPDLAPPTDPTSVASTTHAPSAWSNLREITVEWSGAADTGGSGLAGYSVLFDTNPATLPDQTVDVAHAADPHSATSSELADGQEHYFHLRTCDQAANCSSTVHLGPFWIDATDPVDPGGLVSTSHEVGVPASLNLLTLSWTAGSDALSGVDGYAWGVSGGSTPVCDEGKDLEETALGATSPPLADGSWWFHICTVDNAGNWTSTATAGPYVIDTLAPNDPTTVLSPSHATGSWSNDTQIAVQWSGATDPGGTVAGYSVLFDVSPATLPNTTIDVGHTGDPHGTTSSPLADGQSHWFHLRTCDSANNCTATTHLGPFWIDTAPPEVTLVNSVADTGDGILSEAEASGVPIRQLLITFDEKVVGAGETANFLLLSDGGDGFQTTSCAAGADPGDEVIAIDAAAYSAGTLTSTLGVNGDTPLFDGAYRLLVCGSTSITDLANNKLDGDGNGAGGDDFARSFTLLDTRPTAHPGAERTIDVDEAVVLGEHPAATGGTAPYAYQWTVTPDASVDLSSATEANPTLSCALPETLAAQLVVTDASSLDSPTAATEITVVCPARRDLFNVDFYDTRLLEATELITAEQVIVRTGGQLTLKAGQEVVLMDGFEVEDGAGLAVLIDPSTDCF